ncbi:MAG: hypothetical protein KA522_03530 [Candidatus Saccharicenans sp.]|jgi:hypothetical protein|nr:hypothetical protein [Candidatus Saccharicenans sp.]
MNKAQKRLVMFIIIILDVLLILGAISESRDYDYRLDFGKLSKDLRTYAAFILLGVSGYFIWDKKKRHRRIFVLVLLIVLELIWGAISDYGLDFGDLSSDIRIYLALAFLGAGGYFFLNKKTIKNGQALQDGK